MGSATGSRQRADVVIVGAGPTGLTAAVRFAQLGITTVLLDASSEATQTSNAALVHASTIELFDELGISDRLVRQGRKVRRIAMVDRGRPLAQVELTRIPSRYPFSLAIPQSTTEALLLERLVELGGSVQRRKHVEAVTAHGNGYVVAGTDHVGPRPAPFEVVAHFVIGADGSHSAVRAALGVDFPGDTYPSQFVLGDVELVAAPSPDDEATINMSAQGVTVIGRLPSGNYRIIATVARERNVPQEPNMAFLNSMLRERGIPAEVFSEPAWSSRFQVHHRVAEQFRVSGVFLAGDAAHVHSPAAGQGMNTGIADAFDISTRLAAVIAGQANASVLDDYDRLRRAAAQEVVRFTDRMTSVASLTGPVARFLRRSALTTLGRLGPVRRRITMWVTGLERSPLRQNLPTVLQPVSRPRQP